MRDDSIKRHCRQSCFCPTAPVTHRDHSTWRVQLNQSANIHDPRSTVRLKQPEAKDCLWTVKLGLSPDRSITALAVCLHKADINDLKGGERNSQHHLKKKRCQGRPQREDIHSDFLLLLTGLTKLPVANCHPECPYYPRCLGLHLQRAASFSAWALGVPQGSVLGPRVK